METYTITKDDIKKRIYFLAKFVQNKKGLTMHGALTSKSDSMGGIFDRFINTLSDSLIFDKIIFQKAEFRSIGKEIKTVEDFYFYKPLNSVAGIAPDIFGIIVDGVTYPFTKFDNKWVAVDGAPQIEVKTFKAKDQMISLRNQHYDDKYLILVDLSLRMDYLIPFLDATYLNKTVANIMEMDDSIFIIRDDNKLIAQVSPIDFSNDKIGKLSLICITSASNFMHQATFCAKGISIWRMKEIKERKTKVVTGVSHEKLSTYAESSPRVSCLYEFNQTWVSKMQSLPNLKNAKWLDFSAEGIDDIEILKYNKKGIVITALKDGCSFNGMKLEVGKQYSVVFEILDRSGNNGSEYFMQKQCACYLTGLENELINRIKNIIKK